MVGNVNLTVFNTLIAAKYAEGRQATAPLLSHGHGGAKGRLFPGLRADSEMAKPTQCGALMTEVVHCHLGQGHTVARLASGAHP